MPNLLLIFACAFFASFAIPTIAFAHGYISDPPSRAKLGQLGLQEVGDVRYEPQSLESKGGYPETGPADGKIASAGGLFGGILDEQSSTRWLKNDINVGMNKISWYLTAPHSARKWTYYITKQGWNQNAPLARDTFEHIGSFYYNGVIPPNVLSHNVEIPTDRSGYHVLLGIWDVQDTGMAFYNAVDLNVVNGGGEGGGTTPSAVPPAVQNLNVTLDEGSVVRLGWSAPPAEYNVNAYNVYRSVNGGAFQILQSVNSTSFIDATVSPNSTAKYYVAAVNAVGEGAKSNTVSVTVPDSIFQVTGLHTMGVNPRSVSLMWGEVANHEIVRYEIYRANDMQAYTHIGNSKTSTYMDNTVQPGMSYKYYVVALNSMQEYSDQSNIITVMTPNEESGGATYPQWSATAYYYAGDRVTYNGKNYQARVNVQGHGDPNWNPESALSLWRPL